MKKKKRLIVVLSVLVVITTVIAVLLYSGIFVRKEEPVDNTVIEQTEVIDNSDPNRELWLANKALNNDYIGEIIFDSNLINKPFVQAKDVYDENGNFYRFYNVDGTIVNDGTNYTGNDVYIYMNWKDMSYDYNIEGGSVFMDYRNEIYDQNIIIYGHHFSNPNNDPERIKAFTPLEKLLEEENYEDNKIVKMVLDNETRTYELVYTYIFETDNEYDLENLQYYRTEYCYDEYEDVIDENYYEKYIEAVEKQQLYDTGLHLTTADKTLTLQTCIGGYNGEKVQICVFRLVDTKYFED